MTVTLELDLDETEKLADHLDDAPDELAAIAAYVRLAAAREKRRGASAS